MADRDPLETDDPRKRVVLQGLAHITSLLMKATFGYCHGPSSTLPIEAELATKLIAISRLLERYAQSVARGSVGNVGVRRQ